MWDENIKVGLRAIALMTAIIVLAHPPEVGSAMAAREIAFFVASALVFFALRKR